MKVDFFAIRHLYKLILKFITLKISSEVDFNTNEKTLESIPSILLDLCHLQVLSRKRRVNVVKNLNLSPEEVRWCSSRTNSVCFKSEKRRQLLISRLALAFHDQRECFCSASLSISHYFLTPIQQRLAKDAVATKLPSLHFFGRPRRAGSILGSLRSRCQPRSSVDLGRLT